LPITLLSYKSFQKNYGRSVGRKAPSLLVSRVRRKAESAGGRLVEFPTRKTRLSQFDHSTGEYKKKPLSQRLHAFGDPEIAPVQRDLYSAFLARCVVEDELDISQVQEAWPGAEPLLRRAMSSEGQAPSGKLRQPHGNTKTVRGARLPKENLPRVEDR
jgi:putative transposase